MFRIVRSLQALAPLLALNLLSFNLQAENAFVLHEGTPVRMKINRTVSSGSAQQGETVDFQTLDDVTLTDAVVIPRGSTAIGTVTEAVPKGHMGRGGKLNMNIDYVRLPNGDKLPLRGVQELKGGGHTGAMAGGMVATAIVFWPAAPFFLLMHGKDISIPEGHEVTVYTNSDYQVPSVAVKRESLVPHSVATAAAVGSSANALGNTDIVKLREAGFSEPVIVGMIYSAPPMYTLDTASLVALKMAGVTEPIINAMISASVRH